MTDNDLLDILSVATPEDVAEAQALAVRGMRLAARVSRRVAKVLPVRGALIAVMVAVILETIAAEIVDD